MIAAPSNYYPFVSQLPEGAIVIFQGVTWEEYEELLDQVGEARGLRISYNDGTLKVMSLSVEHETCVRFIERLIGAITIRLRINIISTGSATIRKKKKIDILPPPNAFALWRGIPTLSAVAHFS